tara:strand:+ start:49 stop:192 length:144 start_codon:yes stop_codon:yes gene_type:complete
MNTGACGQSGGLFKFYSKNAKKRGLPTIKQPISAVTKHIQFSTAFLL